MGEIPRMQWVIGVFANCEPWPALVRSTVILFEQVVSN
jgi:hypothetical protein